MARGYFPNDSSDFRCWPCTSFAATQNLVAIGGIADFGKPSARQIYGFTA